MPLTDEQLAILTAARSSTDNLLISALAGAAKTSTLVLIAKALGTTSILSLAFNKKIAEEMKERLSANCQPKTLNGLGHQVWMQTIGKRLTLDKDKTYNIVNGLIDAMDDRTKGEFYPVMAETLRAINEAKTAGYMPTKFGRGLMNEDELFAWLDEAPTPLQEDIIVAASERSVQLGMEGTIDFNDQILLPTIFTSTFPQFPLVLVDEAQDLSALNHAMLRKIAKKRIIAVGDSCQAIYGFRGAHENSMELLKAEFGMRELTLSVSFRCPVTVVEEARWRAPHMKYPEWAKPGTVTSREAWTIEDIPQESAILCRNNAPLFRTALRFLAAGRFAQLIGNDIGKNMLKILKKFGPGDMPQATVFEKIEAWKELKLLKSRSPDSIHDQAECLALFAEQGPNLSAAIAYAEAIFNSQGPVKLMTIHKAKGLEFENVFILDRHLIRRGRGQEDNLAYVAITRAKQSLTYITTEGFQ